MRAGAAAVVILGLLSTFGPLSIDMYLPGLPDLVDDLNTSAALGQLTLTSCMLGLALGQLVAGPLSDAWGRRRPLLVGLIGFVVASAVCAAAPSIETLIVLRLLQGAAGGVGIVIARAVVRDLYSGAAAARMFALLVMITGVAPIGAPLLGGQLMHVTSWRGIFLALAAIGFGLLVMTVIGLRETLPERDRHGGGLGPTLRTFRRLLGDRTFMPYATSFALGFSSMFAYISASSFVIEEVYGVSPQWFSVVFALNALALVIVSQISGRIVGRYGPERLLTVGLWLLCAASLALMAATLWHVGLGVMLAAMTAVQASFGLVLPNGQALALAHQKQSAGAASALLGLGQFASGAAVAPLVGLWGSHTAVPMGVVIGVCGVAALVVHVVATPRGSVS
jgi:DHA1 family bicyclomycin/chloramphenicol resistance-like MFS transporter